MVIELIGALVSSIIFWPLQRLRCVRAEIVNRALVKSRNVFVLQLDKTGSESCGW